MKKYILQGLSLFLLGCSANISLYTRSQSCAQDDAIRTSVIVSQLGYPEKSSDAAISQLQSTPVLVSTSDSSPMDEMDQIIASVGPKKEDAHFLVNTSRDTILQCPEGSILKLNANSFVDASGNLVEGEVKVKVKECYKLKDIIENKLGTTCDGKLIETAGMVNITATSGTETLSLADGHQMGIAMPAGRGSGYDLFYGEESEETGINWVPDEENPVITKYVTASRLPTKDEMGAPEKGAVEKLFQEDTICEFGITKFLLEETAGNYEMRDFNFKDGKGNKLSKFLMDQFTPDKKMRNNACVANIRYSVMMHVDRKGKLTNPDIESTMPKASRKNLRGVLKNLPLLDRNLFDPYSDGREKLKITFGNKLKKEGAGIPIALSDSLNEIWTGSAQNWADFRTQVKLSYYVMQSNRIGWINCDRFYRSPVPLTTIAIEPANESDLVFIFFEDIRSAMAGRKEGNIYYFPNIPVGKNIKVMSTTYDGKRGAIPSYKIKSAARRKYIIGTKDTNNRDEGVEMDIPA